MVRGMVVYHRFPAPYFLERGAGDSDLAILYRCVRERVSALKTERLKEKAKKKTPSLLFQSKNRLTKRFFDCLSCHDLSTFPLVFCLKI